MARRMKSSRSEGLNRCFVEAGRIVDPCVSAAHCTFVYWHSGPGQMKQLTPPCDEHVPLRFCEQLYVRSLQIAVAVPHEAEMGNVTVQMLEPGVGVGLGVGVGVGVGVGDMT